MLIPTTAIGKFAEPDTAFCTQEKMNEVQKLHNMLGISETVFTVTVYSIIKSSGFLEEEALEVLKDMLAGNNHIVSKEIFNFLNTLEDSKSSLEEQTKLCASNFFRILAGAGNAEDLVNEISSELNISTKKIYKHLESITALKENITPHLGDNGWFRLGDASPLNHSAVLLFSKVVEVATSRIELSQLASSFSNAFKYDILLALERIASLESVNKRASVIATAFAATYQLEEFLEASNKETIHSIQDRVNSIVLLVKKVDDGEVETYKEAFGEELISFYFKGIYNSASAEREVLKWAKMVDLLEDFKGNEDLERAGLFGTFFKKSVISMQEAMLKHVITVKDGKLKTVIVNMPVILKTEDNQIVGSYNLEKLSFDEKAKIWTQNLPVHNNSEETKELANEKVLKNSFDFWTSFYEDIRLNMKKKVFERIELLCKPHKILEGLDNLLKNC